MTPRPSPDPSSAVDNKDAYTAIAGEAGLPVRVEGVWAKVGTTSRVQGWKLHLSSVQTQAPGLLRCVLPLLTTQRTTFKFVRGPEVLGALNEGALGDLQVGKFMTIYPQSDDNARQLADVLVKLTNRFGGPVIVTDRRLGEITYARYGGFRPIIQSDRIGQRFTAIYDTKGVLRRDNYTVPFNPPHGVPIPFGATEEESIASDMLSQRTSTNVGHLFGPGFLLLDALKSTPKGSVFLALDLRTQRSASLCVLKQARQHCLSDDLGRDARTRLRLQAILGGELQGMLSTPKPGEYFEVKGHGYLPLEHVEGRTLLEVASTVCRDRPWSLLSERVRRELVSNILRLSQHLQAMHSAGWVHRDLSPSNVLVRTDGEVYLIDLELAHSLGDTKAPFGKGTPGFMAPEQRAGAAPHPSQDVFAVGGLLTFLMCGTDPRQVVDSTRKGRTKRIGFLAQDAPPDLIHLTSRCLDESAECRPSATELVTALIDISASPPRRSASNDRQTKHVSSRRILLTGLEAAIRSGTKGLLSDKLRDPETGLWLSAVGDGNMLTKTAESFELRPDAHHGVAGVVYALARLTRLGYVDLEESKSSVMSASRWLLRASGSGDALPGLYFGNSGAAVALFEAKATGFLIEDGAPERILASAVRATPDWFDLTHGAAGQGVAMMICESLCDSSLDIISCFARYLVDAQEKNGSWRVPKGVEGLSGQTLSGFAHGVAGIVYFLALCSSRLGLTFVEESFIKGAEWLLRTAHAADANTLEWSYSDTMPERWRWWCHGSPGIALAFLEVFRATGDHSYADIARRALNIHDDDTRAANLSVCHGLTGLGEIYLEAARVLDNDYWLARAKAIASTLLALGRPGAYGHLTWMVEDLHVSTADLMIGSAGVLHFLARVHCGGQRLGFPLLVDR
jgi:serine/threonine protein kinase